MYNKSVHQQLHSLRMIEKGAMHKSLELNAQYSMLANQDDIWHEKKIAKTFLKMKEFEEHHPSLLLLVHSDLCVVDEKLNVLASSFWEYQHIEILNFTGASSAFSCIDFVQAKSHSK